MPRLRFSLLILPFLIISFLLLSRSSAVSAAWTFDGFNPTASLTEKSRTEDKINLLMTISDNLNITYTNKDYFFVVSLSTSAPTVNLRSLRSCPSTITTGDMTRSGPCKYQFTYSTNGYSVIATTLKTITAEKTGGLGPFTGNSTYYIYGKINQDDAGNSGSWSNSFNFVPSPKSISPFLETKEGDVHTNENINTPGGQ